MIYSSFNFIVLFPLLFLLYYMIPAKSGKWRNGYLLLVSYLLYANWKPAFALILLGVTAVTYFGGQVLEIKSEELTDHEFKSLRRKRFAWCFALLGLLPLLIFKYYNFTKVSHPCFYNVSK